MRLGDICNINKLLAVNMIIQCHGNYPIINFGKNQVGFYYEYNTNEHTILCSSVGNDAGFINKYDTKIYAKNCFTIIPINNMVVNNLYLYNILKYYQEKIYNLKTGTVVSFIKKELLDDIIIPVPSLEVQLEIVNKISNIDIFITQMENIVKNKKEEVNNILSNMLDTLN